MLKTWRTWTKKELKARLAECKTKGEDLPARRVLEETSMFGPEIKPNTVVVACLDHPKRTRFAQVKLDADENIVAVA